jgi:diacylglycerol kinase (ATP)
MNGTADTLVIVNPVAGGGRALRALPPIRSFFQSCGRRVDFILSKSSADIREQARRAAASGYRYVVALGGDGAFHHLVEGILGTECIAGFLPAGNGNDVAEVLSIPRDPIAAAEALLHATPMAIDLIRIRLAGGGKAICVCAGGAGLDAEAAHLANTRFKAWPGVTRYLAGLAESFRGGSAFELRAKLEVESWGGRALLAAVANGPVYGSGIRIAPDARVDDGWLNVVIVASVPWTKLVEAIPILLTSGDVRFEEVKRFRCRRAHFETDRPIKIHADGEILGETPAEFELLPAALRVMAPQKS